MYIVSFQSIGAIGLLRAMYATRWSWTFPQLHRHFTITFIDLRAPRRLASLRALVIEPVTLFGDYIVRLN
jgi:hypothetical protein